MGSLKGQVTYTLNALKAFGESRRDARAAGKAAGRARSSLYHSRPCSSERRSPRHVSSRPMSDAARSARNSSRAMRWSWSGSNSKTEAITGA
mgnify:FL=1